MFNRRHGDWWFGLIGGATINTYLGDFNLPYNPLRDPDSLSNPILKSSGGSGFGYSAGIVGEWLPPGEFYGVSLKILFMDYRQATTEIDTKLILDTLNYGAEFSQKLQYITISPEVRYNLPIKGLHIFGGIDVELVNTTISRLLRTFENTGNIEEIWLTKLNNFETRLGLHFGAGWDFFTMDMFDRVRVNVTPYISFHGGTTILTDFGSSWNTLFSRVGLMIKFGPDVVEHDTIMHHPGVLPEMYLARLNVDKGIKFPGFSPLESLPVTELAAVETGTIVEEISEKPTTPEEEVPPEAPTVTIIPGSEESFTYKSPREVDMTEPMIEYLDQLATFLLNNPGFEIRIVGHSDNTGTFDQKQRRSKARADQVVRYLLNKGVARGRILDRYVADTEPKASNATAAGRAQNRRVDIVVVQ